ncbi:prolyl oligopeptidase family serine peptidase [Ureibacillus sinduriensis]|uniref:Esterase n=1 Tax=Ureibacillus sinduriensis BLB-1 = JCM 15800 TaxID=1384057 RepID=A0A0A3HTQ3_9BACL|nr:prolyl oligopeptidase family serine peptidase [Ureibacillus sinduriensis]KGR73678.1 esterase [Ureibacillus sinduriensis BLB-1 = JCM 15800]
MYVQDDMWNGIPLLHVYDNSMDEQTPVVIFLHGFQSAKEHNLHYAYQLVQKGVRVIMPDAHLHGVRSENLSEVKMNMHFWEIVLNSIHEVNTIFGELKDRGYGDAKIGVAGSSMGGIVTAGCLNSYDWISAAGICMGAPGYVELANWQMAQFEAAGIKLPIDDMQKAEILNQLAEYDITKDPTRFNGRPLIFWHGHKDGTVPFKNTYHFYTQLRSHYEHSPEQLVFIEAKNSGHKVSRSGVLAVTSFLSQHLA